jgi:hypothetical protein
LFSRRVSGEAVAQSWVCADEASLVTGAVLNVDGDYLAS